MKLSVDLFVREHRSGFFTLQPVADRSIQVYTDDLDAAREELMLLLSDRVERTHPRAQSAIAPPYEMTHLALEVDDALVVAGEDGEATTAPTTVSVLVGERRGWRSLYFPRLEMYFWVPKREDYLDVARELLREHLEDLEPAGRLALRYDRREWVETLEVDAQPPPLSAFAGKNRGLTILPVVTGEAKPEEDDDGEHDDEDATGAKRPKKKRKKRPPTPTLEKIGVPLSRLAADGELGRAFERKTELDELVAILSKKGHQCVAVVGPSGVGKTAVLQELVHRLRAPGLPERVRTRPVWFADASRLVATEGWFGDWQKQTFDVAGECEASDVIWYVGALVPLLDAGKHIGSDQNVSQLLKPYLASRRITVVGEVTDREWSQLELRDAGFARMFSTYRLAEPAPDEARRILGAVVRALEEEESVQVTEKGLAAAEALCRRYQVDGSPLGTTIAFLRRLVEYAAARDDTVADERAVVECFSGETGLPARLVRDDLPLDPDDVRAAFSRRLVGQDLAVERMTDLAMVIKAGMSDLSRPLGSFLFVGPTGVGKTETAKALAAFLFGSEHRLARFDMSEFSGGDAVHRFLGDASHEGKLVEVVRRRPFSVVLLDEIEKAHPAVFDVLLQVLGEARLTDEAGRVADFRNAVIVMTSNLGVETLAKSIGFEGRLDAAEVEAHFVREAERFFRPEMFNRIDHIVPFMPLEAAAIRRITDGQLSKLMAREGIRQRGVGVVLAGDVPAWLAERGVEPRYGARPLKRTIERSLAIPLARHLSQKHSGGVLVTTDGDRLAFEPREATARESTASRARGTLAGLLARIDLLRFRVARWVGSDDYEDLEQEVRLYERLAAMRQFWEVPELAKRRGQGMNEKRALVDAFDAVRKTVEQLEDVAYDEYHRRELAMLETIEADLAAATDELARLELALFSMRFAAADRALLYLKPGQGHEMLEELIETYLLIAWTLGWEVDLFSARRIEERAKASPAEPDAKKKPKKKRGGASERYRWRHLGHFEAPADEPEPDKQFARAWRRDKTHAESLRFVGAMSFTGPNAAAFLSQEDGMHTWSAEASSEVRVTFENTSTSSPGVLKHPNDLPKSGTLVRSVKKGRRIVSDHLLPADTAFEPRVDRLYLRFMRQRIVRAALGHRGPAWAKAWEDR